MFFWNSFENYDLSVGLHPLVHKISHFNPISIPPFSSTILLPFTHPSTSDLVLVCVWGWGGVGGWMGSSVFKLQTLRLMWLNEWFKKFCVAWLSHQNTYFDSSNILSGRDYYLLLYGSNNNEYLLTTYFVLNTIPSILHGWLYTILIKHWWVGTVIIPNKQMRITSLTEGGLTS